MQNEAHWRLAVDGMSALAICAAGAHPHDPVS